MKWLPRYFTRRARFMNALLYVLRTAAQGKGLVEIASTGAKSLSGTNRAACPCCCWRARRATSTAPTATRSSRWTAPATPSYYLYDQLGSVKGLVNQAGTVTDSYTYDVYGKRTAVTGSPADTPFGFAGQYTDAETGFQYLQARYYDPATGQFLTPDPLVPYRPTAMPTPMTTP